MVTLPASCLPAAIVSLIVDSESEAIPADSSIITFSEQRTATALITIVLINCPRSSEDRRHTDRIAMQLHTNRLTGLGVRIWTTKNTERNKTACADFYTGVHVDDRAV